MAVDGNFSTDDTLLSAEFPLPIGITKDSACGRTSWLIIRRGKKPAECGLDTQGLEKFTAYPEALHVVDFARRRYVELRGSPRKSARKTLLLRADLLPHGVG